MKTVTINVSQKLFVIPCGEGFTCFGFDNCFNYTQDIARELARPDLEPKENERGTLLAYKAYERAVEFAKKEFDRTKKPLTCGLTPQLIGLEGKRVEVKDKYGETRQFNVGKSTGWIPCHLELEKKRSTGGESVTGAPFDSVKIVS